MALYAPALCDLSPRDSSCEVTRLVAPSEATTAPTGALDVIVGDCLTTDCSDRLARRLLEPSLVPAWRVPGTSTLRLYAQPCKLCGLGIRTSRL